jgi:hypothetical protein
VPGRWLGELVIIAIRRAGPGFYPGNMVPSAPDDITSRATLWLGRLILVSSRSVNTIIWALLFVAIFGAGIVAGILAIMFRSIGFIGKLLCEAIEEIDRRPVEALEATGASRLKVIVYAIVPQVMPTFWAVSILRWDINLFPVNNSDPHRGSPNGHRLSSLRSTLGETIRWASSERRSTAAGARRRNAGELGAARGAVRGARLPRVYAQQRIARPESAG